MTVVEAGGRPRVIATDLDRPTALAIIGDTLYIAVAGGIARVPLGASEVATAIEAPAAIGMRAYDGALYWTDGTDRVVRWRPGEAAVTVLHERANVFFDVARTRPTHPPFVVDASGIHWLTPSLVDDSGELVRLPLEGGERKTLLRTEGYPVALTSNDDAFYWAEVDNYLLPRKTKIVRMSRSTSGTFSVIAELDGEALSLSLANEGMYIAASPTLLDFDWNKLGFTRFRGPVLFLERASLVSR